MACEAEVELPVATHTARHVLCCKQQAEENTAVYSALRFAATSVALGSTHLNLASPHLALDSTVSTLGHLPWQYLLRWFSLKEARCLRLISKAVQLAIDSNVEAISVPGPEAAKALLATSMHQRLPHLHSVSYQPASAQGMDFDGELLLQIVTALAMQRPGRTLRLCVVCGVSASTRQAQRFNLGPHVLSGLFQLPIHWSHIDIPFNPTVTVTAVEPPVVTMSDRQSSTDSMLSHDSSSSEPEPVFHVATAAAAAAAPTTSTTTNTSDASVALPTCSAAALLPTTLQRLHLHLTRHLSDASCLTHLQRTLAHLTLTNFTGCTAAHAESLGSLNRLTHLDLTWAHSTMPRATGRSVVRATRVAAQQLAAASSPGFWQVLAQRLPCLSHLRVQGNASQVALVDCVVHLQQLESLEVLLEQEQSYLTLVLACVASLPKLRRLYLHHIHLLPSFCSSRSHRASSPDLPDPLEHTTPECQVWQLLRSAAGQEVPHEECFKAALELLDSALLHDYQCMDSLVQRAFPSDPGAPRWFPQLTHLSMSGCECVNAVLRLCLGQACKPQPPSTAVAHTPAPLVQQAPLEQLSVVFPGVQQKYWLPLLPHFAGLRALSLRSVMELGDAMWAAWCSGGMTQRLTALSLWNVGLSREVLSELGRACPRLQVLAVSRLKDLGRQELTTLLHSADAQNLALIQVGQNWVLNNSSSWVDDASDQQAFCEEVLSGHLPLPPKAHEAAGAPGTTACASGNWVQLRPHLALFDDGYSTAQGGGEPRPVWDWWSEPHPAVVTLPPADLS